MHPCDVTCMDAGAGEEAHKQQQEEQRQERQQRQQPKRPKGGRRTERGAGSHSVTAPNKPNAHEGCGSHARAAGTPTATQRNVITTRTRAGSKVEGGKGGSVGGVGSASGVASAADIPSCCLVVEPLPLPVWDVLWACVLGCLLAPCGAGGGGRGRLLLREQGSGPAGASGWTVGGEPLGGAAAAGLRWLGLVLRGRVAMAPFVGVWEVRAGNG